MYPTTQVKHVMNDGSYQILGVYDGFIKMEVYGQHDECYYVKEFAYGQNEEFANALLHEREVRGGLKEVEYIDTNGGDAE